MTRQLSMLFILPLFLSACGGGDSGPSTVTSPSSQTTEFRGSIAGTGGQNGTLTVTVQAALTTSSKLLWVPFIAIVEAQTAGAATATGSLALSGGSTVSLTGTFNSSTKALSVSGGGFAFIGTLTAGVMSGTYSGPSSATGAFSTVIAGGPPAPTTVTGRWVGTAPDGVIVAPAAGGCTLEADLELNLTSSGNTLTGTAILQDRRVAAGCSLSGADTLTLANGTVGSGTIAFRLPGGVTLDFSGTFTNARMTGVMVTGGGRPATFALNRR